LLTNKKGFPNHPDYDKLCDKWVFYLLTYEGGDEYKTVGMKDYLYQHTREQHDDYRFRYKRAIFESISHVIINVWASHIRRKGIKRQNGNDAFELFEKNCDLNGHGLDYFMLERVFSVTQAIGFSYVMIDFPKSESEINSELERKEAGINPYLIHYYPKDVVNWKYKNGKFDWIVFRETDYINDEDPLEMSKSQDIAETYKVWDKKSWYEYDKNRKLIEEGEHKFGEVPVTVFYNKESLIYNLPIGISALKTIAEIDRKIYNLNSLLDEFLYRQCFAQMVMDKETLGQIIETGTTRVLPVKEDGTKPFFLEPPTGGAEFIVSERDRLVDSAYYHAMIRGDNYMSERTEQSGIAKAYDLHDSNQNIAQKAKNMETAENNVHRLLKPFHGEVIAEYPNNFDIKTINEELKEMLDIFKADMGSVTYARAKAMTLVERDLENADPELLKKIKSEIEIANPALDFGQRLEGIKNLIFSVEDIIKQENPGRKESDVKKQIERGLELKKAVEGEEPKKPEPTLGELAV